MIFVTFLKANEYMDHVSFLFFSGDAGVQPADVLWGGVAINLPSTILG